MRARVWANWKAMSGGEGRMRRGERRSSRKGSGAGERERRRRRSLRKRRKRGGHLKSSTVNGSAENLTSARVCRMRARSSEAICPGTTAVRGGGAEREG